MKKIDEYLSAFLGAFDRIDNSFERGFRQAQKQASVILEAALVRYCLPT
jgi:hypothetical protein